MCRLIPARIELAGGRRSGWTGAVAPILHLSLPVTDLDAALGFYVDALGCEPGRRRDGWADVWFFGLQLTLHERPDEVLPVAPGVRHFGVTLDVDELARLLERLGDGVDRVAPRGVEHAGTPLEQRKVKLRAPSGNVIELKAYPDREAALGRVAG